MCRKGNKENMQFRTAFLKFKNLEILGFFFPPIPPSSRPTTLSWLALCETDLAHCRDAFPLINLNLFSPSSWTSILYKSQQILVRQSSLKN